MARIPLGTSGGRMPEVALRLEGEKRADERQKRQLRSETSQFFAQLQQRKAEQQQAAQFQQQGMALTEEKMVFDQMAAQIREEGQRQQRSFGQAATNVGLASDYGATVKWNPATQAFEAKPLQAGEGFEVAKTAKAREKQAALGQQIQNRTSQIMVAYPEFALTEPETVNAMVQSSRTDNQLLDEIGQLAERRETDEARRVLSDRSSRPEQVIEALESLQKYGDKTLWDHALEAEVDARVERIGEKDATHKALERQRMNVTDALSKSRARAAGPRSGGTLGRNDKAIAEAEVKAYTEELKKVEDAIATAEAARLQRFRENPYQKIMSDVIKEVYTGNSGVHQIQRQWTERIQGAVQQMQQPAAQGLTTSKGIAVEPYTPYGQQQPGQQQEQPQQQPQQQPQGPEMAQEGASGMKEFIIQEVSRIKAQLEQAEAMLVEAQKSGDDRIVAAAKDQLMKAQRERDAFAIQYGQRGGSLEEPEGGRVQRSF